MGFASLAEVTDALTTAGMERSRPWQKLLVSALVTGSNQSLWRVGPIPAAGTDPPSLAARIVDDTIPGALSLGTPGKGKTNHLSRFSVRGNNVNSRGTFVVMDRLLDYGGILMTSVLLQVLANAVSLSRYTTGLGVMAFLEMSTAISLGGVGTVTMTYTNELGVGGRVGVTNTLGSAALNRMPHATMFLNLQAGDLGVRSVESVQFSFAAAGGVANLVLVKPMYGLAMHVANLPYERDMVLQVAALETLENGHALMLGMHSSFVGTNPTFHGEMHAVEG